MRPCRMPVDIVGEADAVQDERTGKWVVGCIYCPAIIRAMTAAGVMAALFAHLNDRHRETGH